MTESAWDRFFGVLRSFLFGAAMSWVMAPYQIQQRRTLERFYGLMATMDLHGLPLLREADMLRLLPYFVPSMLYWRRLTIFDRELEGADLKHIGH